MDNEFIYVMYPDNLSVHGIIMLLDVNIDPYKKQDIIWLKELLDNVLYKIGETEYFVISFNK